MILGEDKRECMNCGKMLPYDDFDYDGGDPYHVNSNCKECEGLSVESVIVAPVKIVQDLSAHAPQCPICLSNTGCGCNDVDSDGYR